MDFSGFPAISLQEFDLNSTIRIAIALFVVLGAIVAIIFCVWWGFLLILSGGAEEKIKAAINYIRHAIIGLVAMIAAVFFIPMIINFLNLPLAWELDANRVFAQMRDLVAPLFGNSSSGTGIMTPENAPGELPMDFTDL